MINIIINRYLPRRPYAAMAFGSRILAREGVTLTKGLIAHELVHVEQYERLGMFMFLVTWVWEYLRKGYDNISLEKDAYDKQYEDYYLVWAESVLKDNGIAYPK